MKPSCNVVTLIERYFTERLMRQRNASVNITSYRDTCRLPFTFAQARLRKPPSAPALDNLDAPFISAFLADLETKRGASVGTRNLRLTAILSFFASRPRAGPGRSYPASSRDAKQAPRQAAGAFSDAREIEAILAAPVVRHGLDAAITPAVALGTERLASLRAHQPRLPFISAPARTCDAPAKGERNDVCR
ncbi:hypothetical protein ACVWWI_006594 [Bradyrhizobium sp. USDA 3686]|nr:hypothetical protein [Bradyrhizobium canariense]